MAGLIHDLPEYLLQGMFSLGLKAGKMVPGCHPCPGQSRSRTSWPRPPPTRGRHSHSRRLLKKINKNKNCSGHFQRVHVEVYFADNL